MSTNAAPECPLLQTLCNPGVELVEGQLPSLQEDLARGRAADRLEVNSEESVAACFAGQVALGILETWYINNSLAKCMGCPREQLDAELSAIIQNHKSIVGPES